MAREADEAGMDVPQREDLSFPRSFPEFQRLFPDDAACAAYLEKARWGDGFVCPHCQTADQRYRNACLFGAICPAHGKGAALMLPWADAQAMQMHLDEISRHVARKAHAVVLMDRAGWHTTGKLKVPKNLTIILLPSRAPELNPVENIWQYLRANWLSNRVFEDYNAIVDAGCEAWNKLVAQPETITSIGMRKWAHIGQC